MNDITSNYDHIFPMTQLLQLDNIPPKFHEIRIIIDIKKSNDPERGVILEKTVHFIIQIKIFIILTIYKMWKIFRS